MGRKYIYKLSFCYSEIPGYKYTSGFSNCLDFGKFTFLTHWKKVATTLGKTCKERYLEELGCLINYVWNLMSKSIGSKIVRIVIKTAASIQDTCH